MNPPIKQVIGLVGPLASGKGVVADHLTSRGYTTFSLSDEIKRELETRPRLRFSRRNMQYVGNEGRRKHGNDYWAKRVGELIDKTPSNKIVIDSIRHPEEIEYLRKTFGAKVMAITASPEKRFANMRARKRQGDPKTLDEFRLVDDLEGTHDDPSGQQINECIRISDRVFENEGTVQDLLQQVEGWLATATKEGAVRPHLERT